MSIGMHKLFPTSRRKPIIKVHLITFCHFYRGRLNSFQFLLTFFSFRFFKTNSVFRSMTNHFIMFLVHLETMIAGVVVSESKRQITNVYKKFLMPSSFEDLIL